MKPLTFADTPNWEFKVDEVSANVFTITARDTAGRSIDKTGTDFDGLIEQCRQEAKAMCNRAATHGQA